MSHLSSPPPPSPEQTQHPPPHSAVAATYATVCRSLHISSRPRVLQALHAHRPPPGIFSARDVIDSDASAVAIAAALLATHGASASLIRKFVTTFDPTACPTALSALRTAATPSTSPARSPLPLTSRGQGHIDVPDVHLSSAQKQYRRHPVFVDFSSSRFVTPRAASAILAAVLLIPAPVSIELDLRTCHRVTTLSLDAWTPLLDSILGPPHSSSSSTPSSSLSPLLLRSQPRNNALLSGLALDSCPLRMLPHSTLCRLSSLRWLSMRSSRVRRLERMSDIVNGLPSLCAGLFAGLPVNSDTMNAMHRFARHVDRAPGAADSATGQDDGDGGSDRCYVNQHAVIDADVDAGRWVVDEVGPDLLGTTPLHAADGRKISTTRAGVLAVGQYGGISLEQLLAGTSHVTPVTRMKHYRMFVLGRCALRHLTWLDGSRVESRDFAASREDVEKRYERVDDGSFCGGPSVMRLLQLRELGLCDRIPSRAAANGSSGSGGGSGVTGKRGMRPWKRKRVAEYVPKVPNMEAAIAAAGFPAVARQDGERLSTEAGITVALAAMASRRSGGGSSSSGGVNSLFESGLMRRVEDALLHGGMGVASAQGNVLSRDSVPSRREGVFERCMRAALVGRSGAPRIGYLVQGNERPRQFEYNPGKQSELVYGTALGSLVVLDEESGVVRGCCRIGGGPGHRRSGEILSRRCNVDEAVSRRVEMGRDKTDVFGLSWLNLQKDVFIAGTYDEGRMHVYNVEWMESGRHGGCMYSGNSFPHLTSIHVNSTDERFAVSGWSQDVGIFDVASGRRLETMKRCHRHVINVIKFAHYEPHVLLTSSFDRCVRKWDLRERRADGGRRPIFTLRSESDTMTACFSPDDRWVLVSAVDNEVKQYSAVDGRPSWQFDIERTGLKDNFTRSYYMLGAEDYYMISGSCRESVVRVFNGRTGKCLTTVDMGEPLSVQSLRGNPRRELSFSALLVANDESVDEVIATVDLQTRLS